MKRFFSIILIAGILCLPGMLQAQTGIGTTTPSSSSVLDISSTNKGVLIPRIDYNNRPTGAVDNGMLIYVTANGPSGDNRFYYFNGTQWDGVRNIKDTQTLSLSLDTLRISQGNYVLLRNIYSQLGYTACGATYAQLASDAQNCGSCGTVCNSINASSFCGNGSCFIGNCNSGFGNCDNNSGNGCETNLTSNVNNCGACGTVCPVRANSAANCVSSACGFNCNAGFGNCDGLPANGCEINLTNSVANCGSCGNVCPTPANATAICSASACGLGSCNAGFGNCDGNPANGCETNITNNVNNCGACGNVCSFANGTGACTASACTIASCNAGFANCDGNGANGCETNISSNVNNCGACGVVCSFANGTGACTASACTVASCNAGFANCDGNGANGCETNISSNVNNCGACGVSCAIANGTGACTASVCSIASCNAGFANCDGIRANGCETNISTNTSNCGACGNVCASGHACVGGVCQ